jgi:hypothetical protein
MEFKVIIKKDGQVVTEVMDRGQHLCSDIYKVTNSIGKQLSDEDTGPECDTNSETT